MDGIYPAAVICQRSGLISGWSKLLLVLTILLTILLIYLGAGIAWFVLPLAAWAGVIMFRPDLPDIKRVILFFHRHRIGIDAFRGSRRAKRRYRANEYCLQILPAGLDVIRDLRCSLSMVDLRTYGCRQDALGAGLSDWSKPVIN